ncbi:zinc finger protein 341 [Nilaparvata lugens]|uniref:zinc finger protein 341 n=1 Tax=Nilaparvata lugens TaxID=108931 RepID=UPI00193CB3A9|nr:zinc finger protein 341 [Nilaparvata lugens]
MMARSLYCVSDIMEDNQSAFPFHTVLTTDCQNENIDSGISLATIEGTTDCQNENIDSGISLATIEDTNDCQNENIDSAITLATIEEVSDDVAFDDDDEQDFFQCGKCKEAFTSFTAFLLHKKNTIQRAEINLLTESDIISLGIDGSALDMTDGQSLQILDSCAEIALMTSGSSQICDLPTISSEEVTIATSVTNDDILDEYTNIGSTDDSVQTCNLPTVTSENVTVATPDGKSNDLKCVYCVKSFKCNYDLQQHVRSHTGEKPFQCVICGRAFSQKSAVKKHMATHKVWPKHLCYVTSASSEATKHSSEMPPNPSESNSSQASDEDSTSLDRNCNGNTNDINEVDLLLYLCQFCTERFETYGQWKNHINEHKDEKVFKCIQPGCLSTFKEMTEFVEHSNGHEAESGSTYNCHVCHKAFDSLDHIVRHQLTHSLPSQAAAKKVKCKTCKSTFRNVESLKQHQDMESHRYTCSKCGKQFKTQRYLKNHQLVHLTSADFSCPHCPQAFKKKVYLTNHLRTHSEDKRYNCSQCSSSFYRKDLLQRHLLTHESTKKFKCPFKNIHNCDREFNRSDKLKAHILTHCSKEIHKCSKCDKSFLKPALLRQHKKSCNGSGLKIICPPPKVVTEESNQVTDETSTIEVFVLATDTRRSKRK